MTESKVYQIKVTVKGVRPPIWRRLLVPAEMTLERLHAAIQVAIGWQDCHLHEFEIGGERFGVPDAEAADMGMPLTDERKARLSRVLRNVRAKAHYTYDFGDDWQHEILVEKILPAAAGERYPLCVAGKRRGPVEDSGGPYGYARLLEILRDPLHEEYEEMLEWAGDIDPEFFSTVEVNRAVGSPAKTRPKIISTFLRRVLDKRIRNC